jgi:outer membrane immunogenic protein
LKLTIIAASAALLLSTSAYAADVVIDQAPMPEAPIAAAYDWTGGYIGVNAGGGFGKFEHPVTITGFADGSVDVTAGGFLGGVQIGYNWQSGQMIYGVEADFQGSSVKGEGSLSLNPVGGGGGLSAEAGTKVDWFGTVRARIGYTPVDRFMVYATGGFAYGHVKSYLDAGAGAGGFSYSESDTNTGWTVGAGAEYAVNTNWTIKTEYLYTDLGKSTVFNSAAGLKIENDVAFHTVRVGLNYKF